jgi:MFS family permease
MDASKSGGAASALSPFAHRVFVVLWGATVVGNIGGWIRDTASSWLMTELAPAPLTVALVQAAATLPIFLLSLPAGALSDIVDRRRLMVGIQVGLCCVSLTLALLTAFGGMGPAALLVLTLLAGIGNALAGPVWQSIVPELVPRAELKPAVALNSLGINISRAIGPALAALVIITAGVPAAYLLDVCSYLVILAALFWWRRTQERPAVPEQFGGAIRAGFRYALASAPLQRVLLRAALFFAPASCCWALLPLVVRVQLQGGAAAYGILLAAIGLGAVGGALVMPLLRRHASLEATALGASLLMGLTTAALALAGSLILAALLLALIGAAWIMVLSTLNAAAQAVLPAWVRGRGLAVYLTVFYGSMTGGSLIWGGVAGAASIELALLLAGGACIVLALLARLAPLPAGEDDLTPSHHWPAPVLAEGLEPAGGPVMILVEYRIALATQPAFSDAATRLGAIRRRDGAYAWGLMADASEPERITEWFLLGSWEEHLRQHERFAAADRLVQEQVLAFHSGSAPAVRHLLSMANAGATRALHAGGHAAGAV